MNLQIMGYSPAWACKVNCPNGIPYRIKTDNQEFKRCQTEKCNSYWRTSSLPNQMTCKFALLNPHVSVLEQHLDHCHQSGT